MSHISNKLELLPYFSRAPRWTQSFNSFALTSNREPCRRLVDERNQQLSSARRSGSHDRPHSLVLEDFSACRFCLWPALCVDSPRERRSVGLRNLARFGART